MRRLRGVGVGTLLNYSVEAEQGDDDLAPALVEVARENVRDTIRAIEVCGQENKRLGLKANEVGSAWIAIKLVRLLVPKVLRCKEQTNRMVSFCRPVSRIPRCCFTHRMRFLTCAPLEAPLTT